MPADPEEIHEAQAEGCKLVAQAIPVEIREGAHPDEVVIQWGEAEMVADRNPCRSTHAGPPSQCID